MSKFKFLNGFKDKLNKIFRRNKKIDIDELDLEYGEYEEEYEDEYEDEEDFVPQELTVTDVKTKNADEPPSLDTILEDEDEDEDDYYADDEDEEDVASQLEGTGHSYKEFNLPQGKFNLATKLKNKKAQIQKALKSKLNDARNNKDWKDSLRRIQAKIQSLEWEKWFGTFYDTSSRSFHHKAFLGTLIVIGSYQAGSLIAQSLVPKSKTIKKPIISSSRSANNQLSGQINLITKADPFKAVTKEIKKKEPTKPKTNEPAICEKSTRSSSLPIKLVNTVVLQDSVKSIASVQVRNSRKLMSVREGEKIQGLAEVGKIDRLKVVFKNLSSGRCEYVENVDKKMRRKSPIKIEKNPVVAKKIIKQAKDKGIENKGNAFKIKKSVRDSMIENISEVLTQARAVQIQNPDGSLSFRMQEIVPGSIYSKLGIQEGDIVNGINGKKITNYNELMTLFGQIKDIDHFEIMVKRDGVEQNLQYDFE